MKIKKKLSMKKNLLCSLFNWFTSFAQEIALVKYGGGGDWYADQPLYPTSFGFATATSIRPLILNQQL
jgi:hypothetical protein